MDAQHIFAIERPHPKLLTYYVLQCLVLPPISLIFLPVRYFRYHTMRYRFDDEGISMSWGLLFRRQVNLTYARIQDIHLTSNIVQRWMGLAHIHIQTASGSAEAEMVIEGLLEFEEVRDFLYTRMRGNRVAQEKARVGGVSPADAGASPELVAVMQEIAAELRATRAAIEASAPRAGGAPDA